MVQIRTKLAFKEDTVKAIQLLMPHAAKLIIDSLAQETVATLHEPKAPEQVLSKFIGDKGPSAKVAKKEELVQDIGKLKAAILALQDGGDAVKGTVDTLKEKLEAAENTLTKLLKDAPSQVHELKAVEEAKSSYILACQARKDREQRGLDKACIRRAERAAHIAELKAQVTKLESDMISVDNENTALHKKRAEAAAEQDEKVIQLVDSRIASLTAAGSTTSLPPVGTVAAIQSPLGQAAPPDPAQQTPSVAELQAARAQILELQVELEQAANMVIAEFDKAFTDITVDMMPKVKLPKEDDIAAFGTLFETLQAWAGAGAVMPFDWDALTGITGNAMHPIEIAKHVLGDLWARWYGDGEPAPSAVVPRQVALLTLHSLDGYKWEYVNQDLQSQVTKRAEKGFEAVKGSAKRLRVSK